jgi:hypothetical protein
MAPQKISKKIIIFIKFWWLSDVFFGLFDCDYTPFIFAPTLRGLFNYEIYLLNWHFDYAHYCNYLEFDS